MIERYSLPEMAAVWSERRRLEIWQQIQGLVADAWADQGVVPREAAAAIAAAPPVDPAVWKAREEVTRHDVAAFVDVLAGSVGDGHGRWVHFGLTSSDLLDTALGVQLKEASALLTDRIVTLFETTRDLAVVHRDTVMIGRTHGIWAEPTTFGHKMAGFAFELVRATRRLQFAAHSVSYGKLSGAVGTRATVPRAIEEKVTKALGLNAEPAATQVVGRDRHAAFLTTLAVIGGTLERLATEIRHLQRSEVAEVAEPFGEGQKGSSAMPHKRNPVLSENVTGLARLLRGWSLAGMEDVALWHERDISHSSVERIALPDACLALDFALHRMNGVISGLSVDTKRMRINLEATRGLVFSQPALLALVRAGKERDEAYRIVQSAAASTMESGGHLREALSDELDADTLESVFSLESFVGSAGWAVDHVGEITGEWLREARGGW
ncbi:MAG TPA: adenylosuccinate lyase [Acidimicrobiia bacterium]|nr:adenylosuccinate lyase [Acidimicrobiia bacterium]